MAERRMFAKTIVDSDAFLDMPLSTQALYFHLNMRADDDGFINNPKKISRMIGASDDDLKLLLAKSFILAFENGVIVIKHWRLNNWIRNDRHHDTVYQEELSLLDVKENGSYTMCQTVGCQLVDKLDTEVRLGKDSIDKVSIGKDSIDEIKTSKASASKHKYGEYNHVLLTDTEYDKLKDELGLDVLSECIKRLDEYIEETGKKYKNHNLTIRRWVIDAVKNKKTKVSTPGDDIWGI